jgi:DNA-binding winged helix-turn-helix (wHTH) protein/tetratricopeptide (TPR) repeat protein
MNDTSSLHVQFGDFELDEADARLARAGRPVALAPKAFAVLCALARQSGQLMTKSALLDAVWGHQHVSESVLKTLISELRDALSDDPKRPRYIETASRRGYRFIAAVKPLPARGAQTASLQPASSFDALPARTQKPAMIGRQSALAQIREAWSAASAGERKIFWIAGEAGVGKTTLIENFVAEVGPVACVYGGCVEQHGAGEPYLPILESLGALCRNDAALPAMIRAVAPTWFLQLPWLSSEAEREVLRRELAGVGQQRMLRELGELLEQYTQQQPLLLITEDLHWSDQATLDLINHVARRRRPARLMWLASFRLSEVIAEDHPLKPLRHELKLHRFCDEIVLDPFSEDEVADYVEQRFPSSEFSEAFARALHARTEGLPLFVVNVIDDLVSQGILQAGPPAALADVSIATLQVPESLAGVIEKQIARLTADECSLLEAASVGGVEFRAATVADALGRDARWVVDACDELARRQQWLSGPIVDRLDDGSLDAQYTFRHALYRHVFYQRVGTHARSELHGRVAASMERARAAGIAVTAAELASHYEQSQELLPALRYYAEAAENALRHFAPREALDLTARALELLGRCPKCTGRDELELQLSALRGSAAAQALGGSSLEAKNALERALALLPAFPQHPLRGLVVNALGQVHLVRGEYAEVRALGDCVLAMSQSQNDRLLALSACNMLGQVSTLRGNYREAIEWLERGIADCDAVGEQALRAAFVVDPAVAMHGAMAIPLLYLGKIDQARSRIDTALTRARRLAQPMPQLMANWYAALLEIGLSNPNRVAAFAAELRRIVDDAALVLGDGPSEWFRGWAEAHQGMPREGYRRIQEALVHNRSIGMYSGAPAVLSYSAEALALMGDWSEAQTQLDAAMEFAQRLGERVYLTQILLLKGRIALAQGDSDAARAAMQAALTEARNQQSVWLELTVLVAQCDLPDARRADIDALKEARPQFTGGLDTMLVMRADELLRTHRRAAVRVKSDG